jgi:ABC-type lipoprotein export system ATPase subunit
MIHIRDLDFSYGDEAFRLRIDELSITDRQRVAVIGPSGSGKTTLLHIIAGIIRPDAGQVQVDGHELAQMSDAARRSFRVRQIGLVFQEFELLEYLNVLDNMLLAYRINSALRLTPEVRRRAAQIADDVGIADKLRRFPHQLSQGERQRVAICRAILPGPSLILADEPTGNLDPATKSRVVDTLLDCAETCEAGLVTVTHDYSLLESFDRAIDLSEVRMSETAPNGAQHDSPGQRPGLES